MRYILFVCVDPAAEEYVPQEDNIGEWVAEMGHRNVRVLGSRLKDLKVSFAKTQSVKSRKGSQL